MCPRATSPINQYMNVEFGEEKVLYNIIIEFCLVSGFVKFKKNICCCNLREVDR